MTTKIHITDGVTTEDYDNSAEKSAVEVAKTYADGYDHAGDTGWVVCRYFTDDPNGDEVKFAFDKDGNFEWDTNRQYVS